MWRRLGGVGAAIGFQATLVAALDASQPAPSDNFGGRLIFLGTGSSSGVPRPECMLAGNYNDDRCKVSRLALAIEPHLSKNYRCNPSMVVETPEHKFVHIDVGKTFREAMVRWYLRLGITSFDALILSHDHADATFGIDDVRGVQPRTGDATPVYLSQETMKTIDRQFTYLTRPPTHSDAVQRFVSRLSFQVIEPMVPFVACGLEVTPLPVMHGEDYVSLGFQFGKRDNIVYISDVSRILPETLAHLARRPIDLLVLDALNSVTPHTTHFSVGQALEVVRELRPNRTLLVGMSGDVEHDEFNAHLAGLRASEGLDVQLAHDGLVVPVRL